MSDSSYISKEPMLDMFVFETVQLIEQLEEIMLNAEKKGTISVESVNEIFRVMHTIKGSSAMMMFNNISSLAHSVEDLFYYIRENKPEYLDTPSICDNVLAASDFIKSEIVKIENGNTPDGVEVGLMNRIKDFLSAVKEKNGEVKAKKKKDPEPEPVIEKFYISSYGQKAETIEMDNHKYKATIHFEDDCQMESIRAYTIIHNLKDLCSEILYRPKELIENEESSEYIKQHGFAIYITSSYPEEELRELIQEALFLKSFEFNQIDDYEAEIQELKNTPVLYETEDRNFAILESKQEMRDEVDSGSKNIKQNILSVSIDKLDKLMDLVGEIVITESMVTKNPDLADLQLDNFSKSARQLRKLTDELQDIVMSIRMIPVATVFQKMNRIVRDMCRKLEKEVELSIIGEDTEVDKNIIDHLSDPLMHLIRNSLDHGIEPRAERIEKGKPEKGLITLEAKNSGSDVWIIIKDDGRGLNKEKILAKAKANGMVFKPESELTDKEIYSYILLPGFSTKEKVTEFSGRGVGMDVVKKNIEKVGGSIQIDSTQNVGTTMLIKIPLTLAIVDGMEIAVGKSKYTVPIISIRESFKARPENVIADSDENEMIMIRGECYPIFRIHREFNIKANKINIEDGILVMVDDGAKSICIFADELIGEQQVVVKTLPRYLKKIGGIAGCTIMGDGDISLIIDIQGIMNRMT